MKKSRFTPKLILQALRQAEGGTVVGEICRKPGVTDATFYRRRKPYAGLDVGELRELRALREGNSKLRQIVADLVPFLIWRRTGGYSRYRLRRCVAA